MIDPAAAARRSAERAAADAGEAEREVALRRAELEAALRDAGAPAEPA